MSAGAALSSVWAGGLEDDRLRALLREDAPQGDLSSRALGLGRQPARITFTARGPMVVACIEAAARLLQLCGVVAVPAVGSGDRAVARALLLEGHGPAEGVLLGWKVAQNLVESASGIAGAAAAIVDRLRAAGLDTPLACTRKAPPGTHWWAAWAVEAGGAVMHRLGLSETLLVFPEHRALLAGQDVAARLQALRRQQPEKRLVVETADPQEALHLARLGVDVLQLERFSPAALAELRAALWAESLTTRLAPAGGVTLDNALDYARAGADLLVSSAPYFARPADVKVGITPVPGDGGLSP
ncbi:ModD protein [Ideonella benzenivorans]|uniref:ModD protein n=1 Tax=Ideonella benzenivorans TaxID=2831643 RepID=UPI001CEDEB37|nr:ModD protein [Ideonella benzenivorans]